MELSPTFNCRWDIIINFYDFSIAAKDYGRTQGIYVGDISGLEGIPDGFVDLYDIRNLSNYWLEELMPADLNNDGKVNLVDFAILAKDYGNGGVEQQYKGDISGVDGLPDGYVNNHDLSAFCDEWLWGANDPNSW